MMEILRRVHEGLAAMEWGSVSDWVAAVGTCSAFFLALLIYRRGLRDAEMSQARLLSIVKPPVPVVLNPGHSLSTQPGGTKVFLAGNPQRVTIDKDGKSNYVTTEEVTMVTLWLSSASDETFFLESVEIVDAEGVITSVPNYWPDIGPNSELKCEIYFPAKTPSLSGSFRVAFQDASGRRWQRRNREPVKRLSS